MEGEQNTNDNTEEYDDNNFWSSVEEIAKNIIKVVKDTLRLIKNEK